jgi:hypothetical protein
VETLLLLKQVVVSIITLERFKSTWPLVRGVYMTTPNFIFYGSFDSCCSFLKNEKFINNDGVILHHFFSLPSTMTRDKDFF